ncbi:MAG: type II toxin-antitoxin system RelE/ParE family toxin [Bacteroidales bacterium]|nr:type II toxin-antitoxin system RelE/ParE family toxin [Bacteroidales bacterium]
MKIEINRKAYKDLNNLPRKEAIKILLEIKKLRNFPEVTNIKKLSNFKPSFRKRVGNYRVLFDQMDEKIIIYRILHRKESFK